MNGFYFHARPIDQGRVVVLSIHEHAANGDPGELLGTVNFKADQWPSFRIIVAAGARAAAFLHIAVTINDGTRKAGKPTLVK